MRPSTTTLPHQSRLELAAKLRQRSLRPVVDAVRRGESADAPVGDPAELGFKALWDSPERRRAARRIDPSNDCGFNCIRHELNEWLLEDDSPITVVDDYDLFI